VIGLDYFWGLFIPLDSFPPITVSTDARAFWAKSGRDGGLCFDFFLVVGVFFGMELIQTGGEGHANGPPIQKIPIPNFKQDCG